MQLNSELQQIVSLAKEGIDYIDILRPIVLKKYNVDLFDLLFPKTDTQSYSNFPNQYKNDIDFHHGSHYCSRHCSGATFLCGNSYFNANGGLTKCGYISYDNNWFHNCCGSPDLFFLPNGRPNKTIKSKRHQHSSSHSWHKDGSDYSNNDQFYINRYHQEYDNYDYDF
jgi:hypothetical protein